MSSQALNRYAYVLNNPLKFRDPTGHRVCADDCGGGGGGGRRGGSPRPTPQPRPVPTPPQPVPTGTPVPSSGAALQSAGSSATPVAALDSFSFVFIDTIWRRLSGTRRSITSGIGVSFDLAAGAGVTVAAGIYFDAEGNVGIAIRAWSTGNHRRCRWARCLGTMDECPDHLRAIWRLGCIRWWVS